MKLFKHLLIAGLCLIYFNRLTAQSNIGGYNVYYGNLHNHSNVSDGTGTPDAAYNYAKNTGKLDFFSLSDHSGYINATNWATIKIAANSYNQDGVFTALWGFEWTENVLGHVTIIGSENFITTSSPYNTFTGMTTWLNSNECVAFFNHPGRNNSTGHEFEHFTTTPAGKIVGMELWNKTDRFPVYYYTDGYYANDGNKSWFDEANSRGWKIGASGSEDNHSGTWGTMTSSKLAVLAAANTRTEIYSALKERRFFTTYDKNLAMSFKINGNEMGSTIGGGSWQYQIQLSDGDGEVFTQVQLLKNGAVLQTWTPNTALVNITGNLTFTSGEYYYIRVKQSDNDEAVSSPVWIGTVNQLPTSSITSPVNNENFTAPASIEVTVNAGDPDGTIQKVELFQGSTLLGTDLTSPYSFSWSDVPAGNYTLTARATDDDGAVTTSGGVNIIVNAATVSCTFTQRISSGSDDVEENASGSVQTKSDDIELVYDNKSTGLQVIGLRFNGVSIPAGAAVTNAYIQFTTDEKTSGTCNLLLKGEFSGNAPAFTTANKNVSGRTRTTALVNWSPGSWPTVGQAASAQQTPDLKAIVQEIIDCPGWVSGNSMVFIITGSSTAKRTAESFEGSAAKAALLNVLYTTPSGTTLKNGYSETSKQVSSLIENQLSENGKIICFPIPFVKILNVQLVPAENEKMELIKIYDINGKMARFINQPDEKTVIALPELARGVYILRAKSNRNTYIQTLIKR